MPKTVSFQTNNIPTAKHNALAQPNAGTTQANQDLLMAIAAMLGVAA